MILRIILVALVAYMPADAFGQFWKKKERAPGKAEVAQPNSLDPSYNAGSRREYEPRASRKSTKGPTYGLEQEFYERMEQLEKTRRKNERLMEKPQYSDPLYFGHKRPPKKRKPSKMKYCKECGIRH